MLYFQSLLRFSLVLLILMVCIHDINVSANILDDQESTEDINEEVVYRAQRGVWSRLFRAEANIPQKLNGPNMKVPTAFRQAQIQFVPYDKRTIPIELRKALYAHGIVGRR